MYTYTFQLRGFLFPPLVAMIGVIETTEAFTPIGDGYHVCILRMEL